MYDVYERVAYFYTHIIMNKDKKIKILVAGIFAAAVFCVGIAASLRASEAGFFGDAWNFIKDSFSGTSTEMLLKGKTNEGKQEESAPVPLYKPAYDYEAAVVNAVDVASKSVVSIVISKDLPVVERCPTNPFGNLPPEFQDFFGNGIQFYGECEKGTKKQEIGGGSGFVVSSDGLVVTNKHVVVDKDAEYTVFTNDGKKYDAKVLAQDPVNDLALLKISASNMPVATIGDSDSIKLGQTAIAIGNALGEFRNTVSVGVISGLARSITAGSVTGFAEKIEGVIQTDAAINQGNSGGPLLNLKGEVIGINTAIASGAQNIGFAIPINQARRAIESVKKTGTIQSTYLGVRYIPITEALAKKQNLPLSYGALVRGTEEGPAVIPGSPAEKAGIQAEDIITKVNGESLEGGKVLASVLQKYGVGEKVTLSIHRGEKDISLDVVLGERPTEKEN